MTRIIPLALAGSLLACGRDAAEPPARVEAGTGARAFEPPVVTNAEPPVEYPRRLYDQQIEGTVVLRLWVSAAGEVHPDSTRIAEGSGYAALDSAAVAGVARMRFAPARRDGQPVATPFLQPVHFRHPSRSGSGEGS